MPKPKPEALSSPVPEHGLLQTGAIFLGGRKVPFYHALIRDLMVPNRSAS